MIDGPQSADDDDREYADGCESSDPVSAGRRRLAGPMGGRKRLAQRERQIARGVEAIIGVLFETPGDDGIDL